MNKNAKTSPEDKQQLPDQVSSSSNSILNVEIGFTLNTYVGQTHGYKTEKTIIRIDLTEYKEVYDFVMKELQKIKKSDTHVSIEDIDMKSLYPIMRKVLLERNIEVPECFDGSKPQCRVARNKDESRNVEYSTYVGLWNVTETNPWSMITYLTFTMMDYEEKNKKRSKK